MPSEKIENKRLASIYYFRSINALGGIETFFYELAKKYKDHDLTIYYLNADKKQLKRLKKYVRCVKYNGEEIECERAFFNYNMEIADKVKAKEKILVIHGNYKDLNCVPKGWEKMDRIVAVSEDSAKAFKEITGRDVEVCYNPYTKEEVKPVINCVVASRLIDKCKGEDLLIKVIHKMDEYCKKNNRQYNMLVFSDVHKNISDNVSFRKPRLDIEPFLASADLVFQLSKTEGYGYTTCIAQSYGTKCVLTPCPVYKELGITNAIWLNFDGSNIDEVVEKIFNDPTDKIPFNLPSDRWDELLAEGKSTYKEEIMKNYKVRAILDFNYGGFEEVEFTKKNKYQDKWVYYGDEFLCDKEQYDYLNGANRNKIVAVELIEVVVPKVENVDETLERVHESAKEEVKIKKTTRKSKVK